MEIWPTTLKEIIDHIVDEIRSGKRIPGDVIDESELKSKFLVSGTPVGKALTILEAHNLLEKLPRAGYRVFQPNERKLLEIVEYHAELEGIAASLAARRIYPDQAKVLLNAAEGLQNYVTTHEPSDTLGYYDLNLNFHETILLATNNETVRWNVHKSGNSIINYFRARHCLRGEPERSLREHKEICDAILNNQHDQAREMMRKHVLIDGELILDVMTRLERRFWD